MQEKNYNQKIGEFGETLAKKYLLSKGYYILASNERISKLEIDIVAKISNIIVFVEVKTRSIPGLEKAEDALTAKKIKNLKKFRKRLWAEKKYCGEKIRFDFLAIDFDLSNKIANIKHFKEII